MNPNKMDLDALEREGAKEPFEFTLGGEEFRLRDPEDLDWRVLQAMDGNDVENQMRVLLGHDTFERFVSHDVPSWKLVKLLEAWQAHYGMPDVGEASA